MFQAYSLLPGRSFLLSTLAASFAFLIQSWTAASIFVTVGIVHVQRPGTAIDAPSLIHPPLDLLLLAALQPAQVPLGVLDGVVVSRVSSTSKGTAMPFSSM